MSAPVAKVLAIPSLPGSPAPNAILPATPPDDAELERIIRAAAERGRTNDCAGVLAALDPLVVRLPVGDKRTVVQLMRLPCLGVAGRMGELPVVYSELEAGAPNNPVVRSFGIALAADTGNYRLAGERLAVAAEEEPRALALVSGEVWRSIAQRLTEAGDLPLRNRLYIALARAGWQPGDRPELAEGLAKGAIEALLIARELPEARALLARVAMPELLGGMATERIYAPLWTDIEARLGTASGDAIDAFAAGRLEAFARAPDDRRVRRDAVRAFVLLGRNAEAIEVAQPIVVANGISEDEVMTVSYHARALRAVGRQEAALELMRGFARVDLATSGAAASGLVGLAEELDEAGKPAEALAVARDAIAKGERYLSPYGLAWLRRTEACALGALGRAPEARAVGNRLVAAAAANEAATIEGLLCLKRVDEAAKIAIATLATTEGASSLAVQFQPDGALGLPGKSPLRALWQPLLARPDVKAAFSRAARILPRPLWPSPQPRDIPRAPAEVGYEGPTT